jgi:hypothetical protein
MRVKLTIVDGGLCERDADKGGDGEARESVAEGSPARARMPVGSEWLTWGILSPAVLTWFSPSPASGRASLKGDKERSDSLTPALDHRAHSNAKQRCKSIRPGCSKSQTTTVHPLATRATTRAATEETGDRRRPTTTTVTATDRSTGLCTHRGTVAGSPPNENSAQATAGEEGEATLLLAADPTTATATEEAMASNNKARGHRNNARAQEAGTSSSRRQSSFPLSLPNPSC